MKNLFLKIVLPIIVLMAIIGIIVANQKPIDKLSSVMCVEPFEFESYVERYIADSIEGKTLAASKKGYDKLYKIISTEESITASTTNGEGPLISSEKANICYEKAFKAYFFIFGSDANVLFSNTTWHEKRMSDIKTEAKRLLKLRCSMSAHDSLYHYISYVDGYYGAKNLIRRSCLCENLSDYERYLSDAKKYDAFPYYHNSGLKNISQTVGSNARKGWQNSIEKYVKSICNESYSSYSDFYLEYQEAYKLIKEYREKFTTNWGNDLMTELNEANKRVKSDFSKLNNN